MFNNIWHNQNDGRIRKDIFLECICMFKVNNLF